MASAEHLSHVACVTHFRLTVAHLAESNDTVSNIEDFFTVHCGVKRNLQALCGVY